jgi:predicted TIM-barrel fold metal-dependent hydrolase
VIDVNVYVSRWPFRRLPDDDTPALVSRLRRHGVTRAWTGSFDAVLNRDVTGVNARLVAECRDRGDGLLVPFGAINPMLPGWKDDLRRCVEEHGMPGIRLHPNYHGYKLDAPEFGALLDVAGEHDLIVQIVARMEDERTQHPLVRVPATDAAPLGEMLASRSKLRVVVSSAVRSPKDSIPASLASINVSFDIAALEGVGSLERLLKNVSHERLLFGSQYPLFYFESALLKLAESEPGHTVKEAITRRNAEILLP